MAVSQNITLIRTETYPQLNYSIVEFAWRSTQTGTSYNEYTRTAKYYVSINGEAETEYTVTYTLPKLTTVLIAYASLRIPHKSDGSATVAVRTWMNTDISAGVVELTRTLNLPVIQRATKMDSLTCITAYFDGALTYKYTPKSSSYYNRCKIFLNLGGDNLVPIEVINLGQSNTSQQTKSITLAETHLSTIYNNLTNTKKGVLRIGIYTYTDSGYTSQLDEPDYRELTLQIPETIRPTLSIWVTPDSTLPSAFDGLYIKGKTRAKVELKGEGKYGATITDYYVYVDSESSRSEVGGATYTYTSRPLPKAGDIVIKGSAIDSRGYSEVLAPIKTVIDYSAPQILPASGESEVVAARCDSNGILNSNGTFLKIKAKRNYSKVISSGVQKNFCSIRYRYKVDGGAYSDWTTILQRDATSDEVTTDALLYAGVDGDGNPVGKLDLTSSYLVQVQAFDDIGDTGTTTITVPTERIYMHKAGSIRSLGIGKYAEDPNTIDIAEDLTVKVRGNLLINGGKIVDFPVEEGTKGIWTYRKWNSGIAECWGRHSVTVDIDTAWSPLYYGQVSAIDFPFAFVGSPNCQVSIEANGAIWLTCNVRASNEQTPSLMLYRPSSITGHPCDIIYYAIGKWK